MVCKRSRLGTALLRIAMPAPAFYAVVTMLFTAQFVGLAGQAVAAEFIGVAAAMRGDVIRVSSASSEIPSGPLESGTRIYLGDKIEVASQIHRRDYKQRTSIGLLVNRTLFSCNLSALTIGLSGATTRNDSTIRQYDYKRSDVSLTVNYRLTD